MKSIPTSLHPTDFSSHCEYARELACALARDRQARLVLLHVVPPPTAVTDGADPGARRRAECAQEELKGYREEMWQKLQELPLPGLPVQAERLLAEGDVAKAILRMAQDTSCELIVMGTHGRTDGRSPQADGKCGRRSDAACTVSGGNGGGAGGDMRSSDPCTPAEADVIL
jgi:nucleotide-binding universal stress UspA family protein